MATRDPSRGMPWKGFSFWISLTVVATMTLVAGSFLGYRAYQSWRVERELSAARAFLQQQDSRNASLRLQTVLRLSPNRLDARRLLASLLEDSASPEALSHRRKLIDLQPQLLEPKLALVRTALRLGDIQEATKALNSIKGAHRKSLEFMEVQAELYLARDRTDMALEVYRELIELEPEDQKARVKLAALELLGGPEYDQQAARAMLESLTTDDEFGLLALRALAQDALKRDDLAAALSWSKRASEKPLAELSDRLLYLQALFAAKSPSFDSGLSDLERMAMENPQFVLEFGRWKLDTLGPQQTAAWLEGMPENIRANLTIGVLLADCYSLLKRWSDLESLIRASAWRELEPMRLAFLARAQAGQGNVRRSERTWELALEAAEKHPEHLSSLLAIARTDKRDSRKVLWMIAENDPRNVSARRELYQAYWQEQNADGMLRMMELMLKENGNDRAAKYTVAALLLATGRQLERAARLAKELYDVDSQSLGNAALLGFALHLQGDSQKAAALLGSRNDLGQLGNDAAAYYALILSGCGRIDEARRVLSAVDRQILLPELRAIVDRAFGALPLNAAAHQPD